MLQLQYKNVVFKSYRRRRPYNKYLVMAAKSQKNNIAAFCRTNMLADYIEKLSTDINMISYTEDDNNVSECKYVAMVNACIIIGIMLYMFFDRTVFQSIFGIHCKMSGTKRPD